MKNLKFQADNSIVYSNEQERFGIYREGNIRKLHSSTSLLRRFGQRNDKKLRNILIYSKFFDCERYVV